ncbi:MAG TPA: O-antigen ligase family protein [Bacteroidia bacterium]|jgi:hypothetical protein|nr:O-antigen ligase family protein [Bacteroidia bacterium]HRG52357.1 O-antigen ligase family protein [Bacteroidia bacterium]
MRSLSPKFHEAVYIIAVALLLISLPVAKFMMSVSQIILIVNWLWEGDLKNKFRAFIQNKPALILSSLLLLHAFGLFYTSDLNYGLNDIRIKLPLALLPLIFSTSKPISTKTFQTILQLFLGSMFVASMISILILTDIGIHRKVVDIRDISIFISHIRFGLLISVSIFVAVYLITQSSKGVLKVIYTIYIFWQLVFLVILESITGLSALFAALLAIVFVKGVLPSGSLFKWVRISLVVFLLCLIIYFCKNFTGQQKAETPKKYTLLEKTVQGNLYQHDTTNHQTENGYLIFINYCDKEMQEAWEEISKIKYQGNDLKGNLLSSTLIRFLTSKGLNKDAAAVKTLTPEEISAIEHGEPNVNYQHISSLQGRIHEILWEIEVYKKTGDPNGHSVTQRFEYWKAAIHIIRNNLLFGVGTGDVKVAFEKEYINSHSVLEQRWRLRAHNQYLSIAIGMGLVGLIWFLFTLFYPLLKLNMHANFLYVSFFAIAIISFLTEDTLETQAGVTFFAAFNSYFLFLQPPQKSDE